MSKVRIKWHLLWRKRKVDFEMKEHIIKALKYSNNTLEKKISNLILSESNLKQRKLKVDKGKYVL